MNGSLFSIGSSGKIGKKLVYKDWKGIKTVREYVTPGNPQTDIQQAQRENYGNAAEAWRKDGYTSADFEAWNLYAITKRVKASGWNMFNKFYIDSKVETHTWTSLINCLITAIKGHSCTVTVSIASNKTGILYIGESKTNMRNQFNGVFSVNKYTFSVTGLSELTKYYFYVKNNSAGENARTGIYKFKTPVYVAPEIIDIGSAAIYTNSVIGAYTIINKSNPANKTGKITSIEIWVIGNQTDVEVATFYSTGTNKFSTRDYVNIGAVTSGAKRTFAVDLDVVEGDFIGVAMSNIYTACCNTPNVGTGLWYNLNDKIPCINTDFTFYGTSNYALSLYGIGEAT